MVKEQPPKEAAGKRLTGPRGGKTTVTRGGMFRKNMWISQEQNERLRLLAFRTRRSEGEVIRQGIEFVLALAESAEEDASRDATEGGGNEEQDDEES